jgi:benzil reductase ((S)-benzoin forming)
VVHGTQAFLRHRAPDGVLVNISSGAAQRGRAGWAAYCGGKAAVDRITEAVQLEEAASGLRAYAVAPGVVDTDMQELIRAMPPERFPDVDQFVERKRRGAFNSPAFVADRILDLVATRPDDVVLRLPAEHGQ